VIQYPSNINGMLITPMEIVSVPGGDVLHGMKLNDSGYAGFGEAYFSTVNTGVIKAWKRHREMTMNIVVPFGCVRFVIYDDREIDSSQHFFQQVVLSRDNYFRLTVPPMVWMGFEGLGFEENILLNISNIKHSPDEVDRLMINEVNFDWEN
jgi:dTDP-4-dehydrorhamnose 3,5-epimerase